MSLRFCRRCGWPHVDDATCAEMLRDIATKARMEYVEPSDGSAAVGGSPAGTGAVPPLAPAALGPLNGRQSVAAVVADLPQLDGGEAGAVDGLVPVAAVGAAVVGEVVQFQDGDPAAGTGVAGEGHVTNGDSQTSHRQEVEGPVSSCTGDFDCTTVPHIHGCYGDYGGCDHPEEHEPFTEAEGLHLNLSLDMP